MSLACSSCNATGVPIDLDVKASPPEHVCRKCKRMPRCSRCSRRRNRLDSSGVCLPCLRAGAKAFEAQCLRTCTVAACGARIDVSDTNDHGECPSCALTRLYREHPISIGGAA